MPVEGHESFSRRNSVSIAAVARVIGVLCIVSLTNAQFLGPDTLMWGSKPTEDMELREVADDGIEIFARTSDKTLCELLEIDRIDYGYVNGRLFSYVLMTGSLHVYSKLVDRICVMEGQPLKEQDRCVHWRNYRRNRHVIGCHVAEEGYIIMVTNRD